MKQANTLLFFIGVLVLSSSILIEAEDPYRFFTWKVTYGSISPLGVPKPRGILINGQFPGPTIDCITNDNLEINVFNLLDEPFLITWNGIQLRKTSWQDGVLGTNCPIPVGKNFTYRFQAKDQVGTFSYFPSIAMHRTAGGFGAINIYARAVIPIPYPIPDLRFTVVVSDWYNADHKDLQKKLDQVSPLGLPDGLLINGLPKSAIFTGQKGKLYQFKVSNVGITTSINFRIQGHNMTLVEVEGSHTMQEVYDSIDVHVGQSVAVQITLNGLIKDYFIVASSRFTKPILNTTATLRYGGSKNGASLPLPVGPTEVYWSLKQARTIRLNLTANAARPNAQGSFRYGSINITRTIVLGNSQASINGKLRYAVNSISYVEQSTPLKLADWFKIPGVFTINSIKDKPINVPAVFGSSVIGTILHQFVEIIFQNNENTIQSWHLDGYNFFVVGYDGGTWTPSLRKQYNYFDAIFRHTVQVYPYSWSAILVSLDNKGMWNLRSAIWPRRYLGQQLYVRVWENVTSPYTESPIPTNALLCGRAKK